MAAQGPQDGSPENSRDAAVPACWPHMGTAATLLSSEAPLLSPEGSGRNPWGQLSDLLPVSSCLHRNVPTDRGWSRSLTSSPFPQPAQPRAEPKRGFRVQRLPDAGQGSRSGKG